MDNSVYIIGEIGQNHNGSLDIAKLIIDLVSRPIREDLFDLDLASIDAVKFVKRDLDEELSVSQMTRPYNSPHSFGSTYLEHRKKLELTEEQHLELFQYTKRKGLEVVETLCAISCLGMLKLFTPDRLKVASRDLTNIPLLSAMGETKIPIILSTGMAGHRELDTALEIVGKYHSNISILHCVSEYPTRPEHVNLRTLTYLIRTYPDYMIGYSDHTIGISVPVAAVAMGARIIEKHVTIDRRMKGTDQAGSLGPDGVYRMVRDVRLLESSLGIDDIFIDKAVEPARKKLERSIATRREIKTGEVIKESDIFLLSPGDGLRWADRDRVIGKRALKGIPKNEIIYPELIG
jgi:3-deoxy-D-glycero-D-galacto-nononate 9-phosphate synthase